MAKAKLYVNPKNFPVTRHSYSAGNDWRWCKRLYFWKKLGGWTERVRSAAMEFGNCIEAGLKHHCLTGEPANILFEQTWQEFNPEIDKLCTHVAEFARPCEICRSNAKRNAELKYSDKEKDWNRMLQIGRDLMRLFEIRLPNLPLRSPRFQRELRKEVFPNTEYAGLEFTAYLDIVSTPEVNHPLLPEVSGQVGEKRALVTDVKTTSKAFDVDDPEIIGLDQQLITYSWATEIPDVAFLFFVKASPDFKNGSTVSTFCPVTIQDREYPAGSEFVVADVDETCAFLVSAEAYTEIRKVYGEADEAKKVALKGLRGKARDAAEAEYIAKNGNPGGNTLAQNAARISFDQITTQRIQFIPARIPEERAKRIGMSVGREMVEIVTETKAFESTERLIQISAFPEQGGVRWPNDKCLNCAYRGLCLGNRKLVDDLLVKAGEEWLEEAA